MTKLWLKPVDTFFFKGHQTTEAGADTTMSGTFPPRPNTIYGALRSAFIHQHISFDDFQAGSNSEVKKWMGTPQQLGDFHLDYCGLSYESNLMLPLPLDYQVIEKEKTSPEAFPLALQRDEAPSSRDSVFRLVSHHKEKTKSSANQYVALNDWKNSLLHQQAVTKLVPLSQMLVGEPKLGIALDYDTRQAKKKHLYQLTKLRFKNDGALVAYTSSSPNFNNIPFARIGGENRPWVVQQEEDTLKIWNEEEITALKKQILKSGVARIILLSPAIWEQGARPACLDESQLTLPNGLTVEWLTAAIGRPTLFGGWDIVKHRPKSRYFMVPEGSVIYIKVQPDQVDALLELANKLSMTDQGAQEGFGFAVIAAGNKI